MNSEAIDDISLLILDDNLIDSEILRRILQKTRYHPFSNIHITSNKYEAERVLREHSPSIGFIDYQLGGDSGIELIEHWKTRFDKTNFVLVTGCGDERVVATALRAGSMDYLSKDALNRATVEACLGRIIAKAWDEQQLHSILDASKAGILTFNKNGKLLLANNAAGDLFSVPNKLILGSHLSHWFTIEDSPEYVDILQLFIQFAKLAEKQSLSALGKRRGEEHFPVEVSIAESNIMGNETYIAIVQDITKRKKLEALRDQQAAAIQATTDLVAFTDPNFKLQYLNQHGAKLSGLESHSLENDMDIVELLGPDAKKQFFSSIVPHLKRSSQWQGELSLYNKVIDYNMPVSVVISAIKTPSGPISSYAFIMRDISESKLYQKALKRLSEQDELTRLANKNSFIKKLQSTLDNQYLYEQSYAIIHVNIPDFLSISENFGMIASEEVIKCTANRLVEQCRRNDTVCRCESDKYFILKELGNNKPKSELKAFVDELSRHINQSLLIHQNTIDIRCNIGVAMLFAGTDSAITIMHNATEAAAQVRTSDRLPYRFYDEELDKLLQQKSQLNQLLTQELENNSLQPSFSGIFNRNVGFVGVIVNLFLSIDNGQKSYEFNDISESSRKIGKADILEETFVNKALSAFSQLKNTHKEIEFISFPTPMRYVAHSDFFTKLDRFIKLAGIDQSAIVLLLRNVHTTSLVCQDDIRRTLNLLQEREIGFAIDFDESPDFPLEFLAYTNLRYIKYSCANPPNQVEHNDWNRKLKILTSLCDSLKIDIIASDIKSELELSRLYLSPELLMQGEYFKTSDKGSELIYPEAFITKKVS